MKPESSPRCLLLADRSGMIPGEVLRQAIADTLDPDHPEDEVLFTRLLTDDGGRLLETTELGRYPSRRLAEAVMLAGHPPRPRRGRLDHARRPPLPLRRRTPLPTGRSG